MKLGFRNFAVRSLCAIAFVSATQAWRAQEPAPTLQDPTQQPPTLSITAREVLLDVVVKDSARRPVTGLKASDFTVTEEGAAQQIKSLEEHHPMRPEEIATLKAPALPPNTFTNFTPAVNTNASTVILLDALDTRIEAQMYLREQLINFLKRMAPGTPIAIFQLDTQMRLIQGFSSDPQVLLEAAKSKRDMPSLREPIRGSRDEYIRAKNEILREGLNMMGRYLAGFPGRKNLIWFTGQLPTWLSGDATVADVERRAGNPFKDDFSVVDDITSGFTDALTLSRVAVYPIDARGLQTAPQFSAAGRGRPSMNAGMRFEGRQAFNQMNLDAIAEATGGKAYYNTNGLKDVIAEIVNDGSNYYSVAYATNNQNWDGKFRHIRVTLNRPGLKLEYRPGYWAIDRSKQEQRQLASLQKKMANAAATPYGQNQSIASNPPSADGAMIHQVKGGFDASMQLGAVPPTEIVFTARLTVGDQVVKLDKKTALPKDNYLLPGYKDKPFRTYGVHIQTDAHTIHVTRTDDAVRHGAIQVVTAVYDQTGVMINSLQTTASFDLSDAHYRKFLNDGLPLQQEIAIPVKGNYFLRIGIHDLGNDHVGALEIPVDEVRAGLPGQGLSSR